MQVVLHVHIIMHALMYTIQYIVRYTLQHIVQKRRLMVKGVQLKQMEGMFTHIIVSILTNSQSF